MFTYRPCGTQSFLLYLKTLRVLAFCFIKNCKGYTHQHVDEEIYTVDFDFFCALTCNLIWTCVVKLTRKCTSLGIDSLISILPWWLMIMDKTNDNLLARQKNFSPQASGQLELCKADLRLFICKLLHILMFYDNVCLIFKQPMFATIATFENCFSL